MQNECIIWEDSEDNKLSINIISKTSPTTNKYLELEIADPTTNEEATIVVFTDNRVGFLELLKKVTDECLLRARDEEQKGERDDG